eukprot:CAMPEP_0198347226 /NCGR_PEP_ID=MMETSP1450-20131203/83700_1 /TAXON_ID=753684 ORGANISM="Madagascaria erythrocladiodes, Strain CCMP3234" /NCGR_SAMPLE_ID=MMETSP1450 /ASSEMBLY_ACC=CAM_ASM_001115 /LENGTH=35 /DNA_ID= /DNA_START= /DNA_END= /DNA_ORIENTATION=
MSSASPLADENPFAKLRRGGPTTPKAATKQTVAAA